jgi:para-nitrobenzyl esterase
MKTYFSTLILLIAPLCFGQQVATQFGVVQGISSGGVTQFLGIPYAKPPVGELRWAAPQSPDAWFGVLATTSFAPVCPQKSFTQTGTAGTVMGNEDCLYLNVWSPQLTTTANLPVLVFIHGGGNQQGSAQEVNFGTNMYESTRLSGRGNVVVVTIQYRLGPLGFLAHPGLEPENNSGFSGNYAVLDQILALQWVQQNIAQFGGDPSKVMVFGESAGGLNVANLLVSPLAANLFQRAGIQSAGPSIQTYAQGTTKGVSFVNTFASAGTDVEKIAFMRTVSTDDLVANETAPLSGGTVGRNWLPVIDGSTFLDLPAAQIQSGNYNKVPVLLGSNADEMSLSVPQTVTPGMVTLLKASLVPTALLPQANLLYPSGSTNDEAKASYIGILSDSQFTVAARRTAQCLSLNQTQPVWRYFFSFKHTLAALATYGSYHGMELFYIFNNWENTTYGAGPLFRPADGQMQDLMLQYWVNFAATGNPNGGNLVNWPVYNATTDPYMELNVPCNGSQTGVRTAQCNLWDAVANFSPCSSSLTNNEFSESAILVFPNPSSTVVNIETETSDSLISFELCNLQGACLQKGNAHTIDVSAFSKGIYLLRVATTAGVKTYKIIRN